MDWVTIVGKLAEYYFQREGAKKEEDNINRILNHVSEEIDRVIHHLEDMQLDEFTGRLKGLRDNFREYKPIPENETALEMMRFHSNELLGEVATKTEKGRDPEQNIILGSLLFATTFSRALILAERKHTFNINMDNDIALMMQESINIFQKLGIVHWEIIIAPIDQKWKERNYYVTPGSTDLGTGPCRGSLPYDEGLNYLKECDKAPELYEQMQSEHRWTGMYAEYQKKCLNAIQRINGMKISMTDIKTQFRCKNSKLLPIPSGFVQPNDKLVIGNDKNGSYSNPSFFWDFDNIAAGMQVTFQASIKSESETNRTSEVVIWELGENVHTNASTGPFPISTSWSNSSISYKKVEDLSIVRAEVYWHDQEEVNIMVDRDASWLQSSWE